MMILILSEHSDQSTNDVIRYLEYQNKAWIRINEDDEISIKSIEFKDGKVIRLVISFNERDIDLTTITSYWYRRGWFNINSNWQSSISNDATIDFHIKRYLKDETKFTARFLHQYLETEKFSINSFLTSENNKLFYQLIASRIGLITPHTLITNSGKSLSAFWGINSEDVITKSIHEQFAFKINHETYATRTHEVNEIAASNSFFISLFQKNIEKFIELRVFYLNAKTWTMAIFSQQNEQTRVDFRNYDNNKPNRNTPFNLPDEINERLVNFMNQIGLNCGSIDLILTPDNEYVFLEVNPVGQFGMVSYPCNYHLENEIANMLF